MTWDEFLNTIDSDYARKELVGQQKTTITCPDCGRYIFMDKTMILTSYPAKYFYWCACGWTGCAPIKWQEVEE